MAVDMQGKDFDWREAFSAFRELQKREGSPVEPGARMLFALGGRRWYRNLTEKVRSMPNGERVLSEKIAMGDILNDWDSLRALPEGSVGREYLAWAEERNLTVKSLEEAVTPIYENARLTVEQVYIRDRSRDLHDLFHVITGYGTDSGGETALLAFTSLQHENKSMRVLSWIGLCHALKHGRFDIIALRRKAKHRARAAKLLIAQPWHSLIKAPLQQVRSELNLLSPPVYRAFDLSS